MGFFMRQSVLPQSINSRPTLIQGKHRVPMKHARQFIPFVTLIIGIVIWHLIVSAKIYPPFIIPSPLLVVNKGIQVIGDGTLLYHTGVTFGNVIAGLLVGLTFAVSLGY